MYINPIDRWENTPLDDDRYSDSEYEQKPISSGTTVIINPELPDYEGIPTFRAKPPLYSYIPQLSITDKQFWTASLLKILFLLNGFIPPFARVAATTDKISVLAYRDEH